GGGGGGGGGNAVASVSVSPPSACLAAGQTVQLTATVKDSAGNVTGRAVTWVSSNPGVASVDASGLVTGVTFGSTTITATSKGHSGAAGVALQRGTATASLRGVRARVALGDSGAMFHTTAAGWSPMCSGTSNTLYTIIRNGLGALFVAGAQGTILQFDTISGGWIPEPSGTTNTLFGLARAPGAIYGTLLAVGAGGTVLAFNDTTWSPQSSGTTDTLFSVGKVPGLPADFAVGAGGTILHYDGVSWTTQTSGTTNDLDFVEVLSPTDVYALGAGGTMLHYDGTTWSAVPIGGLTTTLRAADYAVSDSGAVTGYFVVGDSGTILHSSNGVNWTAQASGTTHDLFAVAVASDSNAVAVGALGTIMYYDGKTWSIQR
ncbi:MAG TPA: Ig-like domain-containing protein, partial [Gemmatimonadales bacterium]|nr:Ig-like domain-containing protein [Gemmatimonadales bacterium]